MAIFPRDATAVVAMGVSEPDQMAPNNGPRATTAPRMRSLVHGRVVSRRGIDNADQKPRSGRVAGVWKSRIRIAKFVKEQSTSTSRILSALERTCTMTPTMSRCCSTRIGTHPVYLRSRRPKNVAVPTRTHARHNRGRNLEDNVSKSIVSPINLVDQINSILKL